MVVEKKQPGRPRMKDTDDLVGYMVRVQPAWRDRMGLVSRVQGRDRGQREILEDMLDLYLEHHPEILARIEAYERALREL
jgi:hypothetical protein